MKEKKATNTVESDASKAMNNHLYGWLLMGGGGATIKPIVNIVKEANDWVDDTKGKITETPFGGGYYKRSSIQKKYDEDIANLAGQND